MNCKGCNLISLCLTPVEKCTCRKCIVKMICSQMCYPRHVDGANNLKISPLKEEDFNKLGLTWLRNV